MGIPIRWDHPGQVGKIKNSEKKILKNQRPQPGAEDEF